MKDLLLWMILLVTLSFPAKTQPIQPMLIRANLYVTNEDNQGPGDHLYGGVMTEYFTNYCQCIDNNDAVKFGGGWATEVAISRSNSLLSVEKRDTSHATDTTYFRINNHRNINMMMEFTVTNPYPSNLVVTVYDAVTSTVIGLPTNGTKYKYYFTGIPNAAGYNDNRFKIVLTNPNAYIAPIIPAEYKIYPNPVSSSGTLHIEYPDTLKHEFYLISITGARYKLSVNNYKLILPAVQPGIYILYDSKSGTRNKLFITH